MAFSIPSPSMEVVQRLEAAGIVPRGFLDMTTRVELVLAPPDLPVLYIERVVFEENEIQIDENGDPVFEELAFHLVLIDDDKDQSDV